MAALKYWVWLASLPGVGSRAKLQLLEHFSSPEEIYYAQPEELLLTGAVNKAQTQLLADKSLARAEDVLSACAKTGQFIVTMDDTTYPSRLRDIFDPPLLLYGKGSMPLFDDEAAIAVVGTRSCTAYGLDVASQLGYELAKQGALVLSGMAKGIDGAAMKGGVGLRCLSVRLTVLTVNVSFCSSATMRWASASSLGSYFLPSTP